MAVPKATPMPLLFHHCVCILYLAKIIFDSSICIPHLMLIHHDVHFLCTHVIVTMRYGWAHYLWVEEFVILVFVLSNIPMLWFEFLFKLTHVYWICERSIVWVLVSARPNNMLWSNGCMWGLAGRIEVDKAMLHIVKVTLNFQPSAV